MKSEMKSEMTSEINLDEIGPPKQGRVVLHGSRLTLEHIEKMKIGNGFLSDAEEQLFVDILYEYEGAVAFDDSEIGLLNPEIEPPVVIHTVPHVP
jgi:hypothetical protein